jgi:hypothetical protein
MKLQQAYPVVKPAVDLAFGGEMQRREKNWSPIKFEGERLLLVRFMDPHQVFEVGANA